MPEPSASPVVTVEEAVVVKTAVSSPSTTAGPAAAAAGALVRVAGIIDGDTIDVIIDGERTRIRVIGIDTPERGECGYQEASSAMQSLVQSRDVHLEADPTQDNTDRYNRALRHVFTVDGVNVAEQIIASGLGLEYTYSAPYLYADDHRAAQSNAQQQQLGLWGSMCGQPPGVDEVAEVVDPVGVATSDECLIKGNINREGERIYHRPEQQHYDRTVIDLSHGERWFCTPEEAEEAGWRAAKR